MQILRKMLGKEVIRRSEIVKNYDTNNIPRHIAIIMDGNGRWAQKRGLPRAIGHREGANALKRISKFCNEIGIKFLTVYAFLRKIGKDPKKKSIY